MSPCTVRKSGSSEEGIEREVATTAYPARRNAAARPAPMPREAPVMTATFNRGARPVYAETNCWPPSMSYVAPVKAVLVMR